MLHLQGADLDLDGDALGTEKQGMEGLVAIVLGDGDVVLEATGDGLVKIVHHPEDPVTGVDAVDDDAEGEDVHHLLEGALLVAHLAIDAEEVFLAAHHLGRDAGL